MKVKQLIIKNIGIVKDETVKLNKPLILFYGDIKQGKTTILNAVKWLFGGSFPQDIIRHGQTEASAALIFENGSISREWYVGKDGATKAREITFVLNGQPVKRPVDEIKKFLNPYLLDNEYLKKMSETERKAYFTQLFAVDTSDLDKQLLSADTKARDLRATIKAYGEIDLTEITPVDVGPLKAELAEVRATHQRKCDEINRQNSESAAHNAKMERERARIDELEEANKQIENEIVRLQELLQSNRNRIHTVIEWLKDEPPRVISERPTSPDTSELEQRISEAAADNVRHERYQENLARAVERDRQKRILADLETKQRQIKREKQSKLASISETCGIPSLSFDETGNFTYEGTQAGMLSTSQIMKLSQELSALYPAGFGLDLIDRGESLGKSIFTFVDKAIQEEKTILATIVGEKPADIPENVGVFVVNDGQLTEAGI